MKLNDGGMVLMDLIEARNIAAKHLLDLREAQKSKERWLPAIADAVELQLVDCIEMYNEKIELLGNKKLQEDIKSVVQLAFDFLFEYTLAEDEVPF